MDVQPIPGPGLEPGSWKRSRACNDDLNCIEVKLKAPEGPVMIRRVLDGKPAMTGEMSFNVREWDKFLQGAILGDFDIVTT